MSTHRELLELAAKAAGAELMTWDSDGFGFRVVCDGKYRDWRPLEDDGDEARLESALGLWVCWYPEWVLVGPEVCGPDTGSACGEYFDQHAGDKQAARRRAGVRAAAEIGERMP